MHEAAEAYGFLFANPTSWDCPIIPGESFRPDNMFIFDKHDNIFEVAGTCKINTADIAYVLILEIIEHGRARHTTIGHISDYERELGIRRAFQEIPLGMLYVTVAHTTHSGAHSDDIFYTKNDGQLEYEIIPCRNEALASRLKLVISTLTNMLQTHSNTTHFIGH